MFFGAFQQYCSDLIFVVLDNALIFKMLAYLCLEFDMPSKTTNNLNALEYVYYTRFPTRNI